MGRVAGRDEENPGELHAFMHVLSNGQVTIVNRIEAATEQAETLRWRVFSARLVSGRSRAECWVPRSALEEFMTQH